MQQFTLVDRHTRKLKVDCRELGQVAYLFHEHETAMEFLRQSDTIELQLVEIQDLNRWLGQLPSDGVTHIVEVLIGLTRVLPIKTLANSKK